jgi:hypothetical protein
MAELILASGALSTLMLVNDMQLFTSTASFERRRLGYVGRAAMQFVCWGGSRYVLETR